MLCLKRNIISLTWSSIVQLTPLSFVVYQNDQRMNKKYILAFNSLSLLPLHSLLVDACAITQQYSDNIVVELQLYLRKL